VGRQGGCGGGGDELRGGERRRQALCGEVNGIRSLTGVANMTPFAICSS
jgi:hypothetical protein